MTSLIDYFFIIGPSSDGSQPKVLAHLPKSVPWNIIDKHAIANLASLCLPRGSTPKQGDDEETNFHSFLLTKEDKQMSWGHSLEFWNPSGGLSHSLVIITTRPLILTVHKILKYIYKVVLLDGVTIETFSKILQHLFSLTDNHSLTSLEINGSSICTVPPAHSPSVSLYKTFEKIQIWKIVKILTALLLERQLLILSSNASQLALLTESLHFLLCPFSWAHTYAPLLPPGPDHESFLDAPVPYIMGICPNSSDQKEQFKVDTPGRCIFDMDDSSLTLGGDLPELPLEPQIKDQVTVIFNKIRAEKRESDLNKALLPDIDNLHGVNQTDICTTHTENVMLAKPFRVAFGFVFCGYENFIVHNCEMKKSFNFDKVSFLSEQPEKSTDFLSSFLETQSFASFIDDKISEKQIGDFDNLICRIRESHTNIDGLDELPLSEIIKMESEIEVPLSRTSHSLDIEITHQPMAEFPNLYSAPLLSIAQPRDHTTLWNPKSPTQNPIDVVCGGFEYPTPPVDKKPPVNLEKIHYQFIEKIIKDLKARTNRILLSQMGKRATEELGYHVRYVQKEENVHIGRLCEVLERIFSHGLKCRKSHSALWNFLMEFKKYAPPEAADEHIELDEHGGGYLTTFAKRLAGLDYKRDITPPARSPMADMFQIMKMKSITTDIGRARAWIRLSIEKRLLSHHLSMITSNALIINDLYLKYGILHYRDDWGQCLYHLLSLGKTQDVEFNCFTLGYPNVDIRYRVWVFPGQTYLGVSETTANIYIKLVGEKGETDHIWIENKTTLEIEFTTQNLGRLITLTIGHDNSGFFPKWKVDNVLVRNEVTGTFWNFECKKTLGKSVGDGAIERILPAERLGLKLSRERKIISSASQQSLISSKDKSRDDLQQNLQISVNAISVLLSNENYTSNELNGLLIGEGGLIQCLNEIFLHGMKTSRLRANYAWDAICHTSNKLSDEESNELIFEFISIFDQIQAECRDAGKDGKFQTFCTILIHGKSLSPFLKLIRQYSIDLYKTDEAFLYDNSAIIFLEQMNRILETQTIKVDYSLTKGIECSIGSENFMAFESPLSPPPPESSV